MASVPAVPSSPIAPKAKPAKKASPVRKSYDLNTKEGKLAYLKDYRASFIEQKKKYAKYEKNENYREFTRLVNAEIEETDMLIKELQSKNGKPVTVIASHTPQKYAEMMLAILAGPQKAKLISQFEVNCAGM